MLRKSLLVPLLGCLVLPLVAHAQFEAGDFSLTLGGSGSNSNDWDGVTFTVNGELGYLLTKEAEIGVRQGISYEDFTGSAWNGATDVFFKHNDNVGSAFSDGSWNYGLLIGFRF